MTEIPAYSPKHAPLPGLEPQPTEDDQVLPGMPLHMDEGSDPLPFE